MAIHKTILWGFLVYAIFAMLTGAFTAAFADVTDISHCSQSGYPNVVKYREANFLDAMRFMFTGQYEQQVDYDNPLITFITFGLNTSCDMPSQFTWFIGLFNAVMTTFGIIALIYLIRGTE